jgi:hypothetical protein
MTGARLFLFSIACSFTATDSPAADKARTVVIFNEQASEVSPAVVSSADLWVTLRDLKRATQFEIKPEGVCTATLCFPLPEARKKDFLRGQGPETSFNLSEFARLLKQPVAHDAKHAVWLFGPRSEGQNDYLKTLLAPDFTLPDSNGKMHSLTEFRGKKVLLITWASW